MCSVSGYKCSVRYVSSVGYQMKGNCLVLRYMYLSITSICLVSGYRVSVKYMCVVLAPGMY